MLDWHFEHTPNHRLFVHPRADGSTHTIYWREALQAIYVGAALLRSRFGWTPGVHMADTVISVLVSSDTIPYFILLASCFRANYVVFPISPRNSPDAIAHLIEKVGVKHLLIGHEPAMSKLATEALEILGKKGAILVPDVSLVPLFDELFLPSSTTAITPDSLAYEYKGPDATLWIMHSSGSTTFPKPIYFTNHQAIQACLTPWFGERDLTDLVLSVHGLPMYHGMGMMQTLWAPSCGVVLSTFEPKPFPTAPTPDVLFAAARTTQSDIIISVPAFVEAWLRNPDYVRWLSTRGAVLFGGGPLNKGVGDQLVLKGVKIFNLYGSYVYNPLYKLVEESAALNVAPLEAWDSEYILNFVRDVVHSVMTMHVGDDEDIFQHGCDSLQATWIRNCILASLRESAQLDTRRNTRNFIYDYPSISTLARFLFLVVSGGEAPPTAKVPVMQAMVSKHSQDFPTHSGAQQAPSSTKNIVLVTGTTGELGCHLLSLLLADEAVVKVHALNRSG
ncbi:hypothetical protein FB45DRAFT_1097256 [Roridomyces roridus]|uniref:AMP-dependent synthetase/ligase domain-containing protein n=1 Tax=Roridomyces roridus TaxID=1738132 RepID=A0AAD7BEC2_9AGAR|nr:hypothetical protein FB45DRAFT_1097256 [Roridomyces roridus]